MRQAAVDLSTQPVRNLIRSSRGGPTLWWNTQTPSGSASGAYVADGGPDGLGAYRVIPTSAGQLRINWRTGSDFVPTVPGERWTTFVSIYTNRAVSGMSIETNWLTENTSVSQSWMTSAPFTLNVGWNNIRIEFTTPAGAYFLGIQQLLSPLSAPNAAAIGDEYRATMGALFKGSVSAYADGDSPGWRWTGTPGASESVGYPWATDSKIVRQEVVNTILNPIFAVDVNNLYATRGTMARQTVDGRNAVVFTTDTVQNGGANRINVNADRTRLVPGRTYTALVEGRSLGTPRKIGLGFESSAGDSERYLNLSPTPVGSEWVIARNVFVMPAIGTVPAVWAYQDGANAVGDQFAISRVALIEGDYTAPTVPAGDTPGWRWLGTPGASASVGYPYTLEQIAGKPLATLEGIGGVSVPDLPPFQGRTLYAVFDVINDQDAYVLVSAWNGGATATSGGFRIQTGNTGSPTIGARVDTGNGQSNGTVGTSGNRTPGRHIICLSINDGMTQARALSDNLVEATRTIIPGDGLVYTNSTLSAFNNPGTKTIVSHAYDMEHDQATRKKIMGWLARRYNATPPAGY